jgi:broad specificity phosphatase PhoE
MRRCLESREIVAPATPYEVEDALREIDFGSWEGQTLAWLEAHEPGALERRRRDPIAFRPPQGESFADVAVRLRELAANLTACQGVLVVGHRGTLGVLERLLRGLPLESQTVAPLGTGEFRVLR